MREFQSPKSVTDTWHTLVINYNSWMGEKRNHFLDTERAKRYALARPSFHSQAIASYLNSEPRIAFEHILDVGCGTGQSSIALTKWGKRVDAVDSSKAMLEFAKKEKNLTYHLSKAEKLPFPNKTFDLIFAASSLHWFDRRAFFKEASRVLRPGGTFLVYDSALKEGLSNQFTLNFNQRFPKAYNEVPLHPSELQVFNLKLVGNFRFEFDSTFNDEQISNYFFTLSSVSLSLESGDTEDKALADIQSYVAANKNHDKYIFEVSLTEITKI